MNKKEKNFTLIVPRSLENDLVVMSGVTEIATVDSVNTTPTGHVIKSRGGLGIKILFFHNEFLAEKDNIVKEKVKVKLESGVEVQEGECESVSIGVECSNTNQLPTQCVFLRQNEFKPLSLKVNSGLIFFYSFIHILLFKDSKF